MKFVIKINLKALSVSIELQGSRATVVRVHPYKRMRNGKKEYVKGHLRRKP